jgi:NADPH-dependent 2,4-dienoyl-CoA reductase/sulfur reductase-like enzyme
MTWLLTHKGLFVILAPEKRKFLSFGHRKERSMEFIIIGADAAGMSAASRAKRSMPDLQVTVFEKTPDVSYSAWGLPYNIGDPRRGIEDLVVRKAEVFRQKQDINLLTGHEVTHIDTTGKIVAGTRPDGKPFEAAYDKLLVATGASPILAAITGRR